MGELYRPNRWNSISHRPFFSSGDKVFRSFLNPEMMNLPPGIGVSRFSDPPGSTDRPFSTLFEATHRFQHYAMACPWSFWGAEAEFDYAARLAQEMWDEVDRLEGELSRFIVSSDVYRLNAALRQGDDGWISIGSDTWECLYLGLAVSEITGGAFDLALGDAIESRRGEDGAIEKVLESVPWEGPWCQYLRLGEDPLRARLLHAQAQIDLGALGKGFALDKAAKLAQDWSLKSALISCGQSTIIGFGSSPELLTSGVRGWPVELRHPDSVGENASTVGRARLQNMALSGSAQVLHGSHIIDGRTGKSASNWRATWAAAPSAALSDACSTAFMAMDFAEIENFCATQVHVGALLLGYDEKWQRSGVDVWEMDFPL